MARAKAVSRGYLAYGLAATAVAVGILAIAARAWAADGYPAPLALLAVPAFTLLTARWPVLLLRERTDVVFTLDSAVFVAVAVTVPWHVALLALAPAFGFACVQLRVRAAIKLLHIPPCVVVAALAVSAMRAVSPLNGPSDWELAACLVGGLIFEFGTLGSIAATIHLDTGNSMWSALRRNVAVLLPVAAALAGLGYLAAVLFRSLPAALPLLAVPVGMLLMSSRGLLSAQQAVARTRTLATAAQEFQQAEEVGEILDLVLARAKELLRCDRVEHRVEQTRAGELGAPLRLPGDDRGWLVAHTRWSGEPFDDDDAQSLAALAAIAKTAITNGELLRDIEWRALHDPLTRLPNRALFTETLASALQRRQRNRGLLAVLFVDLDGFKAINDRHGHRAGDMVLREVATRLRGAVRAVDTVARLAGDEFSIILGELQGEEDAFRIAAALRAALGPPIPVDGAWLTIRASIGIAMAPMDGDDGDALLAHADAAMYAAKHARKSARTAKPLAETDVVSEVEGISEPVS